MAFGARTARRTFLVVASALIVGASVLTGGAVPAGGAADEPAPTGRLVVRLADGASPTDLTVATAAGGVAAASVDAAGLPPGWAVVDPGPDGTAATAARLRGLDAVAEVRPERLYRPARRPDDPCVTEPRCAGVDQWYLDAVGAPQAWEVTTGSPDVVVAVLDSGVRASHDDLAGEVVDLGGCGSPIPPGPGSSHGTAVASLAGAATDDGVGMAGMGWDTRPADVRVLLRRGSELVGSEAAIAVALGCVVASGASVVNMSFVGEQSALLDAAIGAAAAADVVMVAAAGNTGGTAELYPAAHPAVIGVGATGRDGQLAPFSGRGSWVDLAAPGVDVVAADDAADDAYVDVSGTSFSAPLVAGTAALLRAEHPDWTAAEVTARLLRTASPLGEIAGGLLDAGLALDGEWTGYWAVTGSGIVVPAGDAVDWGAPPPGAAGIVGMAAAPDGRGYWLVASDGGVFAFGSARFHGSTGGVPLNEPVVGMAAAPDGGGYWLVASDGGVFAFGSARFHGSTGGVPLNEPVVGMAAAPDGGGYWLVASDGGVFAFGSARFHGSMGGTPLVSPAVGMASGDGSGGYWLVAADGGVFAFGGAPFYGASGGTVAGPPVRGLVPAGDGYLLIDHDGAATPYGTTGLPAAGPRTTGEVIGGAAP